MNPDPTVPFILSEEACLIQVANVCGIHLVLPNQHAALSHLITNGPPEQQQSPLLLWQPHRSEEPPVLMLSAE